MALTARDIMTAAPETITSDTPVMDAARLMVEKEVGALPVVDGERLVGFVTEGDLIMQDVKLEYPTYIHLLDGLIMYPPSAARFETELRKAVGATVHEVMTEDPISVQADSSIEDVASLLSEKDISRAPVLDGDKLVGIVSKHDIVRAIAEGRV